MTDIELQALTALVNAETAHLNQQVAQYGEQQWAIDPAHEACLEAELHRRGVLPAPPSTSPQEPKHE